MAILSIEQGIERHVAFLWTSLHLVKVLEVL